MRKRLIRQTTAVLMTVLALGWVLHIPVDIAARQAGDRGRPQGREEGQIGEGRPGHGQDDNQPGEETAKSTEEPADTEEFAGGLLPAADSINRPEDTEEEEPLEFPHGTADHVITEEMLNLTPPSDYQVDLSMQAKAREGKYNAYFLEDTLQTVSIAIDEDNLNYMFQNAADKPTVMTNSVTIGDATIGYTGMKTKGSYTLAHSVTEAEGSDRFSFTINFGKYIKKKDYGVKQNFYGATKICFNNFFFDKSMMKEFFALKLMSEMGVPTPQYGLAKVYINGEYYGVFSMIEALDTPILEQYWNVDRDAVSPYLLKPENTSLLEWEIESDESLLWEGDPDTYEDVSEMIPTVREWVKKINQLSEGKDFSGEPVDVNGERYLELLGEIMDIDEAVKYYAVHSFLCQMDNYFVGMKNYGLYVGEDGRSMYIPWDYDLSFGCYFPCDAESTANYDVDVMYRAPIDWNNRNGKFDEISKLTYTQFPLFHVIYQNDSLMEKFHSYMEDCSKVAALGGTIYSGKTYDPGFFYTFTDRMHDELIEAAGEKLAKNVYYMNGANQPADVASAYPNLAKIIAMRSVGVYAQIHGLDTTVSGQGCNLTTLGNAIEGFCTASGVITAVDAATGIFVTARYTGYTPPALTVKRLTESDEYYEPIRQAVGAGEQDSLVIYSIKNTAESSAYTVNIPLPQAYRQAEGKISFYTYDNGACRELAMTAEDNLYTGETDSIHYIAIVQAGGNALRMAEQQEAQQQPAAGAVSRIWARRLVPAGIVLLLAAAAVAVEIRRRHLWKKRMTKGGKL